MANTGIKVTNTLRLRNITTDTLTGDTKPNLPGDPDYVPPQLDNDVCPINTTLTCPSFSAAAKTATSIQYELSIPKATLANPAFAKVRIHVWNALAVEVATITLTDFDPNYVTGEVTGLTVPDTFTFHLEYLNSSDVQLLACESAAVVVMAPTITWEPIDEFCVTSPVCELGGTYDEETETCLDVDEIPAIPPSEGGGTPANAQAVQNNQWNNGGARVYNSGYPLSGEGTLAAYLTVPHFWVNGNFPWDATGRNTVDSRMNAAGVWVAGETSNPLDEWIGFVRRVDTPVAKTVYVAMSADNEFRFSLNGVELVNCHPGGNIAGGSNFNFLHIYPVDLVPGPNYIEMWALNSGSVGGFVMEIYDNTLAELIAATAIGDLNVLFTTADMDGQPFDLGETIGWSCAPGYYLDNTGAGDPVCKQVTTSAPSLFNTGFKGWANRRRLVDGIPDGFVEENLDGVGLGTYFPPVEDLVSCPMEDGIFTGEFDTEYV